MNWGWPSFFLYSLLQQLSGESIKNTFHHAQLICYWDYSLELSSCQQALYKFQPLSKAADGLAYQVLGYVFLHIKDVLPLFYSLKHVLHFYVYT